MTGGGGQVHEPGCTGSTALLAEDERCFDPKHAISGAFERGIAAGIRLHELVRAEAVPEAQGIYRTVVDAYRIRDKKRECGVRLSLRSLKEALNAPSGAIWTVKQETTITDDDWTVVTLAIEDQNDRPLLMSMIGARPDSFNSELLRGHNLSVETTAVCQWKKGKDPLGTVTLARAGDSPRSVDSNATRCCSFWGDSYQLRAHSVVRHSADPAKSRVNLTILGEGSLGPL
jgi:hypothetical protein